MDIERTLRAISYRHRLKILEHISGLKNEGVIVTALVELIDLTQPTVTHHLTKMTDAGILTMIKDGHYHIYRINTKTLEKIIEFFISLREKCEKE